MFFNKQRTIKAPVIINDIGVHSGQKTQITLEPLDIGQGIVFKREDLSENNIISSSISAVQCTKFCTTLANEYNVNVRTVEHLLAALAALQIDNVLIKTSTAEIPIIDGSANVFIQAILNVGIQTQTAEKLILKVLRPIEIKQDNRWIRLSPCNSMCFSFALNFDNRENMTDQSHNFDLLNDDFITDISLARSFGFFKDAEKLYKIGFAKGSSLDNAVVIKDGKILNPAGLRYTNEMVRHKILDALGDFYLSGLVMQVKCEAVNTGHELNNLIMRKLLANENNFTIVKASEVNNQLPQDNLFSAISLEIALTKQSVFSQHDSRTATI